MAVDPFAPDEPIAPGYEPEMPMPPPFGDDMALDIMPTEDGGLEIGPGLAGLEGPPVYQHDENLALLLDEKTVADLGTKLKRLVEADLASRKTWEDLYARGLKALGFDREADTRSEPFPGASGVIHPTLAMALADFVSREIKELMPPGGPVRTEIPGDWPPDQLKLLQQRASRVRVHMTAQIQQEMPEYRAETERILSQAGFMGYGVRKVYWDRRFSRPRGDFVESEDFILPYIGTGDLSTTTRYTHRIRMRHSEIEGEIASGNWRDINIGQPGELERDAVRQQTDKISGVTPNNEAEDQQHEIWEVHCEEALEDAEAWPYVVTLDKDTGAVLSIYRNWRENDPTRKKREWFVLYPFMWWRGAYPVGMFHLIGGLSDAATGALRALLDTAMWQNMPGGFRRQGAGPRAQGGVVDVGPGQWVEVPGSDDIRKDFLPISNLVGQLPPTLYQLLEWLTDKATGFVTIANQAVADQKNTGPVGTTVALLEQANIVPGAIHSRLRDAQTRELGLLAELNAEYLDDMQVVERYGYPMVFREDYGPPIDVVPVADPQVFSETQRVARAQALLEMAIQFPTFFKLREAVLNMLEALRTPQATIDRLMFSEEELVQQAQSQPPPQDPAAQALMAQAQADMAEVDRKRQRDMADVALKQEDQAIKREIAEESNETKIFTALLQAEQRARADIERRQQPPRFIN
jgi:hypothetical protein